jgi:aryl-alcohol dehydrogenase-like predicted oxidoreductase
VLGFTKCGRPWRGGEVYFDLRPESIREECEASLRRLRVERIDLYQFHWPGYATGTAVEESWRTMVELVEEGKVRWIGVCNFDVPRLERCEQVRHVDSLQPPISLLSRNARRELIPWARDHGTGVICRRRRPAQLDDWLGVADLELDENALAEIESALEATGAGTDEAPQPPPVNVAPTAR